ncbi:Synthetic with Lin-35/Rb [Caenorhabditis elegans]|uniref:Synthetic with Lin-35/Rb n=2 Tax=Caenorhabditis elegans TaxID=6239 RepID=UPI0001B7C44D|nr:Synthetic with Lin-35/Rb [Caenorhabditis elegans]CBG22751.1 Synthetic with Lin-35/Rb [Caenorhabditis elegans]|eukprot:NP_001256772.1 Synthetic with Lin-35/Rb [Caenorhabditis elegans]
MSKSEHFVSKENWQHLIMKPGPSNLALPTTQKFRQTSNGRTMKQTWTCGVCRKELSSKRSYTEHMNIHNKSRPFQCEHCVYAAASQMTLHRHKLRNHTPKAEWGYRCPYCDDAYMEPAGYQQHVQQRHPGLSATYGCPFRICKFTSKSQRHFREHLVKHDRSDKIEEGVDPCALSNQQLVRYMVLDEMGIGFQRGYTSYSSSSGASSKPPTVTIRARTNVTIAPKIQGVVTSSQPPPVVICRNDEPKIVWHLEKMCNKKEDISRGNPVSIPPQRLLTHHPPPPQSTRYYVSSHATSSSVTSLHNTSTSSLMTSSTTYVEPLPQTYSEINPEFECEADEDDDYLMEAGEAGEAEAEEEEEEAENDVIEGEYEDDGPPVLESFGNVSIQQPIQHLIMMEEQWSEDEVASSPTADGSVFPNGLIDEELD